ncbi:MAG: adenylate kinase [Clostridiales bacterium]|nr:adenylate kinase [Clostridiales bacterium]
MNIIFLGPPGAGKGTQAQIICANLGIPQISTGDMLRSAIAAKTETGMLAKTFMDGGQLVPDEVVIAIVKERLAMDDCQKGYILDGFPRTVQQATELGNIAKIDVCIDLDVDDEVLVKRLSGRRVCPTCGAPYHVNMLGDQTTCKADGTELIQRDDDKAETVLSRLQVYHQKTAPLIDFYAELGLLKKIEANAAPDEISDNIMKTLEASR